ncbi:MAG: hypothetical protein AAF297_09965 [Planctomycetota bacterium]
MVPRVRFVVWVGVVVGTLVAACGRMASGAGSSDPSWGTLAWSVLNHAGVGAMIWLLLTTPIDAIKLNRWVSVGMIVIGASMVLMLRTWMILPPWEQGFLPPYRIVWNQILMFSVGTVMFWQMLFPIVPRYRYRWGELIGSPSPWWGVVVLWSPLVHPLSTAVGVRLGDFPWPTVVLVVNFVSSIAVVGFGRFGLRSVAWIWIAFSVSVASGIARDVMAIVAPL